MIILQILQKKEIKQGALPTFDPFGDYKVISQQFFTDDEHEKVEKLRDEINNQLKDNDMYKAHIYSIW